MDVKCLHCPQCGGPVEAASTGTSAICGYCGSNLRVTTGAHGRAEAVAEGMRTETSLIAKQAAINHLQERLMTFQGEKEQLVASMSWESNALIMSPAAPRRPVSAVVFGLLREHGCTVGCATVLTVPLLCMVPIVAYVLFCGWLQGRFDLTTGEAQNVSLGAVAVLALVVVVAYLSSQEADQKWATAKRTWDSAARVHVYSEHADELERLDDEIDLAQARIDELKAEMDELAHSP